MKYELNGTCFVAVWARLGLVDMMACHPSDGPDKHILGVSGFLRSFSSVVFNELGETWKEAV